MPFTMVSSLKFFDVNTAPAGLKKLGMSGDVMSALRISDQPIASDLIGLGSADLIISLEPMEALRILSNTSPVNGRFETIHSATGWTGIIDYAHTPDAVENVLKTINEIVSANANKQLAPTQVITVVGCGGNRDKGKRPIMARIAYDHSTQLILTSDNPRDEQPQDILHDMAAGLTDEELQRVLIIEDRASAIKTACTLARKGDVILVAGKGHEDYKEIKGVRYPFDERVIIKEIVNGFL